MKSVSITKANRGTQWGQFDTTNTVAHHSACTHWHRQLVSC